MFAERQIQRGNLRRQVEIAPGVMMPTLGFGTAGLQENTVQVVKWALEAGYTLLDTAQVRLC